MIFFKLLQLAMRLSSSKFNFIYIFRVGVGGGSCGCINCDSIVRWSKFISSGLLKPIRRRKKSKAADRESIITSWKISSKSFALAKKLKIDLSANWAAKELEDLQRRRRKWAFASFSIERRQRQIATQQNVWFNLFVNIFIGRVSGYVLFWVLLKSITALHD